MKNKLTHSLTALFLILSLGFVTACKKSASDSLSPESIAKISTHEEAAEAADGLMGKMIPILESVTDEASAKAAAEKLEAHAPAFEAMDATMKRLGEPSEEQMKAFEEKYKNPEKFAQVMFSFMAKPELMEILSEAMPDM